MFADFAFSRLFLDTMSNRNRKAVTHRQFLAILVFNVAYLAVAILCVFFLKNLEFVFYITVMLILLSVLLLVHRRVGLSAGLLWGLSVWGALHMAGGLVPIPETWPFNPPNRVLYSWWMIPNYLKYDQLVHAYGFAVTTWLCWQTVRVGIMAQTGAVEVRPTLGLMILCAAGGMGFGALNEVIEFIAVLTIEGTNVGGYENTGWDLVANLVGVVIAAFLIWRSGRRVKS
jgi:hypothetical protein